MTAGDDVVVGAGLQVTAEVKSGPHAAAERTLGFKDMALFVRLHRLDPFDHDTRNHHDPHLQAATSADRLEMLFLGIPLHRRDLKVGLSADGTGDLI
jgi:hypothetical protein